MMLGDTIHDRRWSRDSLRCLPAISAAVWLANRFLTHDPTGNWSSGCYLDDQHRVMCFGCQHSHVVSAQFALDQSTARRDEIRGEVVPGYPAFQRSDDILSKGPRGNCPSRACYTREGARGTRSLLPQSRALSAWDPWQRMFLCKSRGNAGEKVSGVVVSRADTAAICQDTIYVLFHLSMMLTHTTVVSGGDETCKAFAKRQNEERGQCADRIKDGFSSSPRLHERLRLCIPHFGYDLPPLDAELIR